jgi:hypothetical protein
VSYEESKKLQQGAHLLLCIEDPIEDVNASMFFPSKILDYMTAGKKYFALTSGGSQLSRIFQRYNWSFFNHGDSAGIAEFIKDSFRQLKEENKAYFLTKETPDEFNAEKNAIRLNLLFKKLCERYI